MFIRRSATDRLSSFSTVLLAFSFFAFAVLEAKSQTQSWSIGTSGDYTDPTRWDSNDVPDSVSETAEFDVFGIYTVNIPQSIGSSIDRLEITRGDLRFFSSTFGDETLSTENGIEIKDAKVDLDRKTSFGNVHFASSGSLVMSEAAQLGVLRQSSINVNGVDIAAGSNSQTTELLLNNNQTSSLGNIVIANRESGSFEGALNVYNDSMVSAGNIDLATTGVAGRRGFMQLLGGGTVTQSSGITNVGANSTEGEASLFLASSTFLGDEINVYSNGRINLVSAHFGIASSLTVDGGLYEEANSTTRTVGTNADLTFKNQAEGVFTNQDLILSAGQTLSVASSTLSGDATVIISSGDAQLSGNSLLDTPVNLSASGSLAIIDGDSTFTSEVNQEGTFEIATGANATFSENFFGNSILGEGTARFEDTVKPNQISSPLNIAGNAELGSTAELEIAIGGTTSTEYDQVSVGNSLTLGGVLGISLIDLGTGLFAPTVGDEFQLLSASSISGTFDEVHLPFISNKQQWQLVQTTTELSLRLVDRGDYNGDGVIDAADYTVWRDSLGNHGQHLPADGNGDGVISLDDYNQWTSGMFDSSTLSQATSVPEPASSIIFIAGNCLLAIGYTSRLTP